jgi:hypothetical protein
MRDTKPFASLSSGLLARKGMAKPAMRPQGYGHFGGMEDLGWNDMGQSGRSTPKLTPEPVASLSPEPVEEAPILEAVPPLVVEQQRDLETHFAAPVQADAVETPKVRAPKRQALEAPKAVVPVSRAGTKAKAAFTLRLDPERHLRLRLACAVSRRSAQMLVTEALDTYLDSLPELDGVSSAKAH